MPIRRRKIEVEEEEDLDLATDEDIYQMKEEKIAPKQVLQQVQVSEPVLVGGSLLTPEKGHHISSRIGKFLKADDRERLSWNVK